jgi:hypothetical protein
MLVSAAVRADQSERLRVGSVKRATGVKVEGRKNYAEINPAMIALARKLRRYPVKGRRRSLRQVANELAAPGYVSSVGAPYTATAILRMLKG